MTDFDALFRPLPDIGAPKLPAALTAELGLEMAAAAPAAPPTLWSMVTPLQLLLAAALVALGALAAVWWGAARAPNKQPSLAPAAVPDIVARVRDVVRAHTGPSLHELSDVVMENVPEPPRVAPRSVAVAPAPPPIARPAVIARPVTAVERANETGVWLRDGLAARGLSPEAVAAIVALAVRSIMASEKTAAPPPVLEPKAVPVAQPVVSAPPRGTISTRGLVLPVYDPSDADETQSGGTKTGRINPAADDRVKQMLKERGLDKVEA